VKTLALHVCKQFTSESISEITALGNGLINDTFLVKAETAIFVLQRINTQVFPKPDQIMENLRLLNEQSKKKSNKSGDLIIPDFIRTLDQQACYLDECGRYWRALAFVENTITKEQISHQKEAEQVGFSLGRFHCLLSDVDIALFHDTLPGFHITPEYYLHYQTVEKQLPEPKYSIKSQQCKDFITNFHPKINVLEDAKNKGLLVQRMIHGDPKLNNFLFDKDSNKIVSLIDLDTVKPGLVHYDIADCLRSCCHKVPENTFDIGLCKIILNSYLQQTSAFFTEHDYDFLYPAIELIPFELGLRFFTDYLQGNRYFKVDSKEQNLDRALAQFQLCDNIGKQEQEIRQLIYGASC